MAANFTVEIACFQLERTSSIAAWFPLPGGLRPNSRSVSPSAGRWPSMSCSHTVCCAALPRPGGLPGFAELTATTAWPSPQRGRVRFGCSVL